MSANGRQNLWKDMLLDLQDRTSFWLKKIHEQVNESMCGNDNCGGGDNTNKRLFSSILDDEFQQIFLQSANNRLIDTYSTVKWELKLSSHGLDISNAMSSDSDNSGQGNSGSSNNDNNTIMKHENDGSSGSMMAVNLLPNEDIKREIMDDDLPIIAFENPDIAKAKARNGNKQKKHMQKRFKCSMCKYVAKRKWILALHRQWHLTEKPYKCRYCPKRFNLRSKCKRHSMKHAK